MQQPSLILASSSIYRQELLQRLRLAFISLSPAIDESPHNQESPEQTALRLAKLKAKAIQKQHPKSVIIGSDQVADLNGRHLGKPHNRAQAIQQLMDMQGQSVVFHTALCVAQENTYLCENITTSCQFRNLSLEEVTAYVDLEPSFDVAGSAKIEALGISLMTSVQSTDPTALIGLPLITLTTFLRQLGISPLTRD